MIAHIVLFRPRPELTPAERQAILESLASAASQIPSVRRVRVGRRIRHGLAGYEAAMSEDYQYAAIVEFDNLEGLTAYLAHPAHADAGRHFTESSAGALAYDYEIADIGEAAAGWTLASHSKNC